MRIGRSLLVIGTLVTIMLFPLLVRDALQALRLPSAYAAANAFDPSGRVYQNGNFQDDDDDDDGGNNENNDESDNEGEDNDNGVECYLNLNENEPVPCDFEDNDNDVVYPPEPAPAPAPPPAQPDQQVSRCYDVQEVGDVRLTLPGGTIRILVVPTSGFPSATRVTLRAVDPSTVPAPPGGATVLDSLVWAIDAQNGCDGPGIGQLPSPVNLGIPYNVPADKSKLQIVRLEAGQWVNVDTVPDPDPNNPYISSTIQTAGTYAVIQRP